MPTAKVFGNSFFPSLSNRQRNTAIFVLVWVLSAWYLGMNLNRGWVPADDGILAHSAERVLNGELPHRDFDEPYTGGLAYLDAAAFRLFGVNLMVLRVVLFSFFLLWVPAVFAIAREFCSPWPAAGVTFLCVAWSVPNYPAGMPSWYCLFFATFGVLFLTRYLRTPHSAWLIVAGLCGSLSFGMKTPGLYYVAGVLLFLVFREQALSATCNPQLSSRSFAYSVFVVCSIAAFLALLIRTVLPNRGVAEFLHFVVPALALSALLLARERWASLTGSQVRFRRLFALILPFVAGVALPIILIGVLYWRAGAFHALVTDLFVAQVLRVSFASLPPPHWIFELAVIPLALVLFHGRSSGRYSAIRRVTSILAAAFLLLACSKYVFILVLALNSARAGMPFLTLAVAIILFRWHSKPNMELRDQQLMLLVSVAAMTSLIQFPYANPLYFCYFAAFAVLTLVALLSRVPDLPKANLLLTGVFFTAFAVFIFRPITIASFAFQKSARAPDVPLALPRAGNLRVFQDQALRYQQLIPLVTRLSAGSHLLAGPDSPQVYFLSGLQNPTPFIFDFFRPPEEYKTYLEQLLDRPGFIKVVVLNNDPGFSLPHRDILRDLVLARFSESRKIDHFEVFWRP